MKLIEIISFKKDIEVDIEEEFNIVFPLALTVTKQALIEFSQITEI